ncbi:hypothetical protein [Actinoalloteichus hymeniacidonis]|uniref:Uncharacterized protein n=1 Tax=Actinoalloteichus hymeniacidonis TaxID=340345 RepID=A0AAC9N100_9PSEU|nr:hypothetical protein [Actinoalloteichus hymeniacidonis]AOS65925.1 hypothetical protein TL08_25775 [Actinoalloteichus hymeniacidonis]MBB5905979.1 hypothetical protein [Actinoalloteichus hymeniacidonis]
MSTTTEHVELREDLRRLVETRLLDPVELLLPTADTDLRERLRVDAEVWAAQLLGPDDQLAVGLLAKLIAALYPGDVAFDPPATWWRTPLGAVTVRRLGHPGAAKVSAAVAGSMLGITRQGVHDLVKRGKLVGHPDGGVVTESIRARLQGLHRTQAGDVHV